MNRVALYARISTREGKQFTANQLDQLRRYAQLQGWAIAAEFLDEESGTAPAADRPALEGLLAAAARRDFDLVLVWALDRLTREGVHAAFSYITRLKNSGVGFVSMTEEHFRSTGPAGDLFIAIAAWIARQERDRHVERVQAGLERARRNGKRLGRPTVAVDTAELLAKKTSLSLSQLAISSGISKATLCRRLRQARANSI